MQSHQPAQTSASAAPWFSDLVTRLWGNVPSNLEDDQTQFLNPRNVECREEKDGCFENQTKHLSVVSNSQFDLRLLPKLLRTPFTCNCDLHFWMCLAHVMNVTPQQMLLNTCFKSIWTKSCLLIAENHLLKIAAALH